MTRQDNAFLLAKHEIGVKEVAGPRHSSAILDYFGQAGQPWVRNDETAWCAAFVGAMLARAGLPNTGRLNARSYLEWGERVDAVNAKPGDVAVFWRVSESDWRGHVGFSAGWEQNGDVAVLGGNQGNAVTIAPYPLQQLLSFRRWPEPPAVPATFWQRLVARLGGKA